MEDIESQVEGWDELLEEEVMENEEAIHAIHVEPYEQERLAQLAMERMAEQEKKPEARPDIQKIREEQRRRMEEAKLRLRGNSNGKASV